MLQLAYLLPAFSAFWAFLLDRRSPRRGALPDRFRQIRVQPVTGFLAFSPHRFDVA